MADFVNIIPKMTSNTTPSGVAFANAETQGSAGYGAWRAFDRSIAEDYAGWLTSDSLPGWVGYKFVSPKVINSYAVVSPSYPTHWPYAPSTWQFQGSNDGTNWTTVDTRSGITWSSARERKEFSIASPQSFLYYRLYVTTNASGASTSGAGTGVDELQMSGGDTFIVGKNQAQTGGL